MDAHKGDWYENEIGKVYNLIQEVRGGYKVSKKKKVGIVRIKDCEVID
ncbi:hypothetical protein [Oceanirhabdus sp. W0125-5]|nr:hypothetical protein [Oceanirhabdus sp. W0125-5]WBW95272.1 hypothetical protein OW730_16440 [Oceanirhabdus sp. W0125-5]